MLNIKSGVGAASNLELFKALGGVGSAIGGTLGAIGSLAPTTTTQSSQSSGTQSTRRMLTPEAIDKLIYDVLSSDQGLANLAQGENLTGVSRSSSKDLMAQDFATKLIGELAAITSEQITETEQQSTSSSKSKKSVICTELHRQGRLSDELYQAGKAHFESLPQETVEGYQIWGARVVKWMQSSPALSAILAPIAVSRYLMITGQRRVTFWGAVTVYLGQPLCFVIGKLLNAARKEPTHGNQC